MFDTFKKGFVFAMGFTLGKAVLVVGVEIAAANTDCIMEYYKDNNPKMYERIKKFRFK